jgi:hypothetical protein
MNRVPVVLLAALFALTCCSLPASATVRADGAKVRWVGERPAAAKAGQDFSGRFEVIAARPGMLENLRVEGSGWTVQPIASGRAVMAKGQRRGYNFTARPSRETEPLVVTATFDGHEIRKTLRLDEASLARAGSRRLSFKDGPPRLENAQPRPEGAEPRRAQTTAFHFTGRLTYMRGGGVTPVELGADNIVVKIWDEDAVFDELIWEGGTDVNGNFDVHVNWDDCDISGCDDPDIYLEFITRSQVVDVQDDDLLETTYSWESPVMNNFTGNTIAFGTMMPDDPADYGACHVYTTVMRAARFAALYGMTPPMVDCIWPSDIATSYSRDDEEMYVNADETWHEFGITHEFGHHLHYIYGNFPVAQYGNGYCDNPTPSHCMWCPENDQDAFKEGWAHWFASVVIRSYSNTYGIIPSSIDDPRFQIELVNLCSQDQAHWPGPYTEGFVAAVLRDIDDPENEDQDGGAADCYIDATSLGADQIMTVFRDDDPTDIWQFLTHFRARYPQYDQDLWSTLQNVWPGFAFPLPAPIVTSQPQTCVQKRVGEAVTLSVNGNGSLLRYQWRRNGIPVVNGIGVSGATTKNLTLSPLGLVADGSYDCVVKSCDGTTSVTTQASRITVLPAITATSLVSWGENVSYQVGNGTNTGHVPPYQNPGISDVIQVEGGREFTIALRADGQVFTWGVNVKGQLGLGSTTPSFRASPGPSLMAGAVQVAAGQAHAMAITGTGTLAAWGDNFRGQIGDGTQSQRDGPVAVGIGGCVIAVGCGFTHTIALRSDGVVYSWGLNVLSALGRGTNNTVYPVPEAIPGLSNVVAISASGYTNLALKSDGTVWAWGSNQYGQLGIGSAATDVLTPTKINGLSGIRSIIAGNFACYAIGSDGSAWSWGSDFQGSLGTGGSIGGRNIPGTMALSNPRQIVSGEGGWGAALMQDRRVKVWGNNADWISGSVSPLGIHDPMFVPGIVRASAIGSGTATVHACGFKEDAIVGAPGADSPIDLALAASPNPSVGPTRLAFDLPRAGHVTLAIYDLAGRRVRLLVDGMREPGRYDETWDGRADVGSGRAAGVYFARLQIGGETLTERIVRIR